MTEPRGPLKALIYATNSGYRSEDSLREAVTVHAAGLSRSRLLQLLFTVLWLHGDACRMVDRLTGTLERVTGASSTHRLGDDQNR